MSMKHFIIPIVFFLFGMAVCQPAQTGLQEPEAYRSAVLFTLENNFADNPQLFGAMANLEVQIANTPGLQVFVSDEFSHSSILLLLTRPKEKDLKLPSQNLLNLPLRGMSKKVDVFGFSVLRPYRQNDADSRNLVLQLVYKKNSFQQKSLDSKLRIIDSESLSLV